MSASWWDVGWTGADDSVAASAGLGGSRETAGPAGKDSHCPGRVSLQEQPPLGPLQPEVAGFVNKGVELPGTSDTFSTPKIACRGAPNIGCVSAFVWGTQILSASRSIPSFSRIYGFKPLTFTSNMGPWEPAQGTPAEVDMPVP